MRILIIGAGIIGTALADRLTRSPATSHRGATVTLVEEQPRPGTGTTASSLAWLNANDPTHPAYHRLRVDAMRAWSDLAAEFDAPPWHRATGNITWATGESARGRLADRVDRLTALGYAARPITARQFTDLEPAVRTPPGGAFIAHFPGEGFVHGAPAAQALAARARNAGADLITGHRVTRIETAADRVTGARLDDGRVLHADVTVCAAGWGSQELLDGAGVTLALTDPAQPGSAAPCLVATTTPAPGALTSILHTPDLYLRPTPDQGLLLEAGDVDAAVDLATPQPALHAHATRLLDRAHALIPGLTARLAGVRRCVRPLPADGFPLIGWLRPGLYTAVTHSGITLAPLLAELISREIHAHDTDPRLNDYRPERSDDSPPK